MFPEGRYIEMDLLNYGIKSHIRAYTKQRENTNINNYNARSCTISLVRYNP